MTGTRRPSVGALGESNGGQQALLALLPEAIKELRKKSRSIKSRSKRVEMKLQIQQLELQLEEFMEKEARRAETKPRRLTSLEEG